MRGEMHHSRVLGLKGYCCECDAKPDEPCRDLSPRDGIGGQYPTGVTVTIDSEGGEVRIKVDDHGGVEVSAGDERAVLGPVDAAPVAEAIDKLIVAAFAASRDAMSARQTGGGS